VFVTIPEALAIEQLDGILAELDKNGFSAEQLIVNNVIKEIGDSAFLKTKSSQQMGYLGLIHRKYSLLQIVVIPLFPHEIKGIDRLRQIEQSLYG
jgi:arsenite-transporting ATPase